jgi:hypothetical protein
MDEVDRKYASQAEALGLRVVVTKTVMTGAPEKKRLAQVVMQEMGIKT